MGEHLAMSILLCHRLQLVAGIPSTALYDHALGLHVGRGAYGCVWLRMATQFPCPRRRLWAPAAHSPLSSVLKTVSTTISRGAHSTPAQPVACITMRWICAQRVIGCTNNREGRAEDGWRHWDVRTPQQHMTELIVQVGTAGLTRCHASTPCTRITVPWPMQRRDPAAPRSHSR